MSGDRGSVSGVLVCWSLDLGSTPDRSLSFSFPLDHLGLSMLNSKLNISIHCLYSLYFPFVDEVVSEAGTHVPPGTSPETCSIKISGEIDTVIQFLSVCKYITAKVYLWSYQLHTNCTGLTL